MSFLSAIDPLYSLSGFAVGVLVGQTGVGGGSLMTPLLILLFGIHPATAVGTDLLFAAATKTVGTLVHGMNKTVDWRITGRLACGSIPATILTLLVISRYNPVDRESSALISTVLGVALILTSIALVFQRKITALIGVHFSRVAPRRTLVLTVAMGAMLGFLVSISSVGAGAIGVTALLLLYPLLPISRIVGSDVAHAVPLTLIAGMGHWMLGSVDWALLSSLLVGSIPGIMIGSYYAARMPDAIMRPVMALTLAAVGGKLLF